MIAARHRGYTRAVLAMIVLSVLAVLPVGGCTVVRAARGEPGLDISPVRSGALREEVETRMGASIREWTTSQGITYRLYRYDAGIPPSVGDAIAYAFLDLIWVGTWELFMAFAPDKSLSARYREYHFMAVSYGRDGSVIGVFPDVSELAVLPENGRPAAAAAPLNR